MWESWVDLAIAVWLIAVGIRHQPSPGTLIVAGTIATTFGFWIASTRNRGAGTTAGLLGAALFTSAVLFPMMPTWVYIASGCALAVFATWDLATHHHRAVPPPDEDVPRSIFEA